MNNTTQLTTEKPRNARFWTFENGGWVKLTVRPGAPLHWSKFSRDDEGFGFERNRWSHEGEGVRNDWCRGGRDCDGYTEESGAVFAEFDELAAVRAYGDENDPSMLFRGVWIKRPQWRKCIETRCRDEFAEAAGY